MKLLATEAVINGAEINVLHKKNDTWIIASQKEFENEAPNSEGSMTPIDEEYLYTRVPKLKGNLEQEDGTTINIDYSTGEVNVNPQHMHMGIPTHVAKSSRQANAGFSLIHYLKVTRSRYKVPLLILACLVIASITIRWYLCIPVIMYLCYKLLEISKTRDMYYSGALSPAIVIDASTSRIASLTNMSMGNGSYPIIRIRKYPLPKKYLINGKQIPVAGTYQITESYNHWNYYEPNPLPTGIKDDTIIEEKIKSIPSSEWVELKNEIRKFKEIPKEGYYPIQVESSDWKDIDLNSIEWIQFGEEK